MADDIQKYWADVQARMQAASVTQKLKDSTIGHMARDAAAEVRGDPDSLRATITKEVEKARAPSPKEAHVAKYKPKDDMAAIKAYARHQHDAERSAAPLKFAAEEIVSPAEQVQHESAATGIPQDLVMAMQNGLPRADVDAEMARRRQNPNARGLDRLTPAERAAVMPDVKPSVADVAQMKANGIPEDLVAAYANGASRHEIGQEMARRQRDPNARGIERLSPDELKAMGKAPGLHFEPLVVPPPTTKPTPEEYAAIVNDARFARNP